MSDIVRFEEAVKNATTWVRQHQQQLGEETVIIRDLYGRIRIAINRSKEEANIDVASQLVLEKSLGRYSAGPDNLLLFPEGTLAYESIIEGGDVHLIESHGKYNIHLLDRQVMGQDWLRSTFTESANRPARVTFYGVKGGVGRSTAMAILSLELAKQGKKVMTLDFDLESPGISNLLLPVDHLPPNGIIDWLIEDGVGQSDAVFGSIIATSPLGADFSGEIRVVPCFGQNKGAYIEKLSRIYIDGKTETGVEDFATRLHRLLTALEQEEKPDIVLIDSRAGLHDLAAIAITRLQASVFLFATRSTQTWSSYQLLFSYWQRNSQLILNFRDNLKVVDSLVPETGREEHRDGMLADSYKLFQETIYEETSGEDWEAYNFQLEDEDSPHYPLVIRWNRAFQEFDPIRRPQSLAQVEIESAYGDFVKGAIRYVLGG